MTIPYPGIVDEKERQNIESTIYKSPFGFIKYEFDFNQRGSIGTLPKDSILYFPHIIYIENYFDCTIMNIGTIDDTDSVAQVSGINNSNIPIINVGILNGVRTQREWPLFIGFNTTPTKGKGWLILKYILWSRV